METLTETTGQGIVFTGRSAKPSVTGNEVIWIKQSIQAATEKLHYYKCQHIGLTLLGTTTAASFIQRGERRIKSAVRIWY